MRKTIVVIYLYCCVFMALMPFALVPQVAAAFELNLSSIRVTASKPETSHLLTYQPTAMSSSVENTLQLQPITYDFTPKNNERLGVFAIINGVEVGYALDVFREDQETKTENLLFSYTKFRQSRITFNYQLLEGFRNRASESASGLSQTQFSAKARSTKFELFGLHNLWTFKGESLFEHFFLNKPRLSDNFSVSLSAVGGWSVKQLSLKSPDTLLFTPNFSRQTLPTLREVSGRSFGANIGPMVSVTLPRNIHMFAEWKLGTGYFDSDQNNTRVKQTGGEKAEAIGAGLSWTAHNKKTLVLLRAWQQQSKNVEIAFGDLSLIRFFD